MQHEIEYQQQHYADRKKSAFMVFMPDCELSQLLKTTLIGNRSPKKKTLSIGSKKYLSEKL